MFRETVTSADGTTGEGTCDEAHALSLLQAAVRHGYAVEATRAGGAVITRTVHDGGHAPREHTVVIEPLVPAGKVTEAMRRDLAALAGRDARSRPSRIDAGRINACLYSIPPAAARRLASRGLVTVDGDLVAVSLAARLVMLTQDHRTGTSEPRGYHHPEGRIGRGPNGVAYDRGSVASCSCRWSYPASDRDDARRRARGHRQEVTAGLVRSLAGEEACRDAAAG